MRTAAAIAAALLALAACRGAPPEDAPIAVTAGKNGFEPWKITARQGKPLTLVVTRTTDETCATEIVIPEAGIEQPLPLLRPVTITFTPARSGELRYSCAMKMFQGVIEVR